MYSQSEYDNQIASVSLIVEAKEKEANDTRIEVQRLGIYQPINLSNYLSNSHISLSNRNGA
jgi:hypothetical protein